MPQIFSLNGRTVRTPSIDFLPLGSGPRESCAVAMTLNPGESFQPPPFWFYNIEDLDLNNPHENPSLPTVIQGGMFLNVNVANEGKNLNNIQFFFDTGADVTVVSELNARPARIRVWTSRISPWRSSVRPDRRGRARLFRRHIYHPGHRRQHDTYQCADHGARRPESGSPSNIVPGIVGTNLLAGRNLVIDPNPALGGGGAPRLYISDPVDDQRNWTTTPSGTWQRPGMERKCGA